MPSDPAAALSALLRSSTIHDHEEYLKAANAALKANKSDITSQHTRVVALLSLDRFEDALRAIDEGGDKLAEQCVLEKTYALYKIGKLEEATALLESAGEKGRGLEHLAAQVAYRADRFGDATQIYDKLAHSEDLGDEENDVTINRRAVAAQMVWQGAGVQDVDEDDLDTFELCYNVACAHIARGNFDKASELLQRAARLCDGSDELTDEDKQAEMQPILAQQAYVYAKLGKTKEATDLYKSLSQAGTEDQDLTLVVGNNQSTLDTETTNPFLVQRKADALSQKAQNAKLFKYQSDILARNSLVVDLNAQKVGGISKRTARSLSKAQLPSTQASINSLSVLKAAAGAHGLSESELTRKLQDMLRKSPDDLGLALTIVQVQVKQGKIGAALSTLEAFLARLEAKEEAYAKDARFSPGVVALNVSLMRNQGREASAKTELVKSARYWKDRPAGFATALLREAGIELLRSSSSEELDLAGSAFEKLFKENHGTHIAAAGLVASLATSDPQKAKQHIGQLPAVDDLIGAVDVKSLIATGVASLPKSSAAPKRRATDDDVDKKAAKKRRKRKLPENYDPNKTPDPERWLPLRDRSSYRPKGKKGKKKVAESTQGGVVKEEEKLGLVGGGDVKVERAPAAGAASKKKKKGKK